MDFAFSLSLSLSPPPPHAHTHTHAHHKALGTPLMLILTDSALERYLCAVDIFFFFMSCWIQFPLSPVSTQRALMHLTDVTRTARGHNSGNLSSLRSRTCGRVRFPLFVSLLHVRYHYNRRIPILSCLLNLLKS